jgi:hypothetical protein
LSCTDFSGPKKRASQGLTSHQFGRSSIWSKYFGLKKKYITQHFELHKMKFSILFCTRLYLCVTALSLLSLLNFGVCFPQLHCDINKNWIFFRSSSSNVKLTLHLSIINVIWKFLDNNFPTKVQKSSCIVFQKQKNKIMFIKTISVQNNFESTSRQRERALSPTKSAWLWLPNNHKLALMGVAS